MTFRSFTNTVSPLIFVALLPSCASIKRALDEKPAAPSAFMEAARPMEEMGARCPFQKTWTAVNAEQLAWSARRTEIYIAPVETRYVRDIGHRVAARQHRRWNRERPIEALAALMRDQFVSAFERSPNPRYRVVQNTTSRSVTLELSLIELDPTSVSGNVAKKAASVVAGPAVSLAGGLTRGRIAIEGRLSDSTKGWPLFEFADCEHDKMTFWTLRDFKPYGHAKVAIKEWAAQFERTTRDPSWREMGDARLWTLRPW